MHCCRFRTSIGVTSHWHTIESTSAADTYDLAFLLNVSSLVALVKQLEKSDDCEEGGRGVERKCLREVVYIPIPEVIAKFGQRRAFLQALESRAGDARVGYDKVDVAGFGSDVVDCCGEIGLGCYVGLKVVDISMFLYMGSSVYLWRESSTSTSVRTLRLYIPLCWLPSLTLLVVDPGYRQSHHLPLVLARSSTQCLLAVS